jgi:hypothetical protein
MDLALRPTASFLRVFDVAVLARLVGARTLAPMRKVNALARVANTEKLARVRLNQWAK